MLVCCVIYVASIFPQRGKIAMWVVAVASKKAKEKSSKLASTKLSYTHVEDSEILNQ